MSETDGQVADEQVADEQVSDDSLNPELEAARKLEEAPQLDEESAPEEASALEEREVEIGLSAEGGLVDGPERSALLQGLASGAESEDGWQRVDFRRNAHNLASKDLAQLDSDLDRFLSAASGQLGILLRRKVQFTGAAVDLMAFKEFAEALSEETSLYPIACDSLKSRFFLSLSSRWLLAVLERLLGASPDSPAPVARPLTELEENLITPALDRLLLSLADSWRAHAQDLGLRVVGLDAEEARRRDRPRGNTPTVVLRSKVEIDGVEGQLAIAVPEGPLLSLISGEPTEADVIAGGSNSEGRFDELIIENLREVGVTVRADLETAPLPLRALLSLQPGDLIDTGVGSQLGRVALSVAGRPIAEGTVGRRGQQFAVQVSGE